MNRKKVISVTALSALSPLAGVGYYTIYGINQNAKEYEAKELAKAIEMKNK